MKTTKDQRNTRSTKGKVKDLYLTDITTDVINQAMIEHIDNLKQISAQTHDTAKLIHDSLTEAKGLKITVDTKEFEQLTHYFIAEMNDKLRRVKRPSNGLKWYIVMWAITLISAFLTGYFIYDRKEWKGKAIYWYQQYEAINEREKRNKK